MTSAYSQNGFLLIDKPTGMTSHDVVAIVRKKTGIKRVGHAGTLDPFATGLLIILIGREQTKRQSEFLTMDKTYEAVIRLGATSTTDDCTGEITPSFSMCHSRACLSGRQEGENSEKKENAPQGLDPRLHGYDKINSVSLSKIQHTISSFIGTFEQMPPNFSAKKIKGKKAYELARAGIHPDLKPKRITIHSLELLSYVWPLLKINVSVSSGTYIRALARDIGAHLECGAYCEELIRTSIGPFHLKDSAAISEL